MPPFTRFNMMCRGGDLEGQRAERFEHRPAKISVGNGWELAGGGCVARRIAGGGVARGPWAAMPGFGGGAMRRESNAARGQGSGAKKKIPIGVFDPVYDKLSLDQMLDTMSALGLEAMEIGTGGYPNNPHCPIDELIADKAKAKAWKKKFEDKGIQVVTLSCHGNAVHPDEKHAAKDAETFRKTVQLARDSRRKRRSSHFPDARRARRRIRSRTGSPIAGRPNTGRCWTGSGKKS